MRLCVRPFACVRFLAVAGLAWCAISEAAQSAEPRKIEANRVAQITLVSEKTYPKPFMEVELDAVVTRPDGKQLRVPAFWAGDNRWCFRYASDQPGQHAWRTECSDKANAKLHGIEGKIEVVASSSDNPLYRHGPIREAKDHRHFEHADGTPFFWLGDTWWKGLCKRLTWEGFQELTANRKAKGFSVVQIVCGPYPNEGVFEPRWENEGGKPYLTKDFSVVNPAYFDYADRRFQHLVESGFVPAIVGGWHNFIGPVVVDGKEVGGRYRDGMIMETIGEAGMTRHWRNLIARYAAYPVVWVIGGEAGGPQWTALAKYVQATDPYQRPLTMHPTGGGSARSSVNDQSVVSFDMLQTGHGDGGGANVARIKAAYACTPPMPVVNGESCYESHMQTAFPDTQRYVFWGGMLSGAAGHTYGAAGVWHSCVEGDAGNRPVFDWTTWREGMNLPGSTQLGMSKKLLEKYPWWRFELHPEWVEEGSFAAGIPGEVRVIYQPKRGYNWCGPRLKNVERDVPYAAFYFDPASGRRFDLGTLVNPGPPPKPFVGHTQPRLFEDRFEGADASAWKDYGQPSQRKDGRLVGSQGMTILEKVEGADLMVSVDANSDAETCIILRFHDPSHYLSASYSPSSKRIVIDDVEYGWGHIVDTLETPAIGPKIRITAAVCGEYAALSMTDGTNTFSTPVLTVSNVTSGKVGVRHGGERQAYDNFEVSKEHFAPAKRDPNKPSVFYLWPGGSSPPLPSPQDWVLVLERVKS